MIKRPGMDAMQALRYALLSFISFGALGIGDAVLRYTYSLYLAFKPESFLADGRMLLLAAGVMGVLGGWLDGRHRAHTTSARVIRALLLALILVTAFQVFRQALATKLPLPGWAKAGAMLGCVGLGALAAWRMRVESATRLGNAATLAIATLFALQPGAATYLLKFMPSSADASTAASAKPAPRRNVVIVFDEWDMELSEREGLFDAPSMRELLSRSYSAQKALPAGPNTLESIPGMLMGQPFGEIERGGPGFLVSKTGQRLDAQTSHLFKDLNDRGLGHAVIGYYHDYCAVFTTARDCHAEPVLFFPGWKASFQRVIRRHDDLTTPYSVFLRQWNATYMRLHAEALRAVEDRANAMVWIHINVPHPPSALASRPPQDLRRDYLANLELTRELIDTVRQKLQAQGDEASLILTSDHWLRERELWKTLYEQQRGPGSGSAGKSEDQRVPLIVWFNRGDSAPVSDATPVSTLALRPLVLGLLDGKLKTPQEVSAFFATQPPPIPPRSGGAGVH